MRIKIIGYYDIENLADDEVDASHPSGLSADGFDNLITGANGRALSTADLEDVEVELVDE